MIDISNLTDQEKTILLGRAMDLPIGFDKTIPDPPESLWSFPDFPEYVMMDGKPVDFYKGPMETTWTVLNWAYNNRAIKRLGFDNGFFSLWLADIAGDSSKKTQCYLMDEILKLVILVELEEKDE